MADLHKFDFIKRMIPKIFKPELDRRFRLIIPCVKEGNDVFQIKNCGDPIKESFSWQYQKGEAVGIISFDGLSVKDRPSERGGWYLKKVAERVGEFITLHRFNYYGFYKPSIEEVLAQLPKELFDEKKLAGRTLYFINNMISDDINTAMLNQEHHIAKTTVYISIK